MQRVTHHPSEHQTATLIPGNRLLTSGEVMVSEALLASNLLQPESADLRFIETLQYAASNQMEIMNDGRRAYLWRIACRHWDQLSPLVWVRVLELRPRRDPKSPSSSSLQQSGRT